MREVYAVGVGITSFTRLEYPISEIAAYPAMMALKDAGLSKVDHVYVANMGSARLNHQSGLASAVVDTLSLTPAGAEVIENGPLRCLGHQDGFSWPWPPGCTTSC